MSAWWDPNGAWQRSLNLPWADWRASQLVLHAQRHSAYLRDHWAGWRPGLDDWRDLPPTRKHDLMAHFDDWVTDPAVTLRGVRAFTDDASRIGDDYLGRYAVWTSSGTTGEPGLFVQDAQALSVYAALTAQQAGAGLMPTGMLAWWGGGWSAPRSALVSAVDAHYAGVSFWRRTCRLHPWMGARSRLWSVTLPMDRLCAELQAFAPEFLCSYPSMLVALAERQAEGRLQLAPRALWAGGEGLTPTARALVQQAFQAPLVNDYGASECMNIAFECPRGRLHLHDDWVRLEPIDEQGRPVPAGVVSASVLITNLANRVQPIVRYELGDSVLMHADACACGNPRPSMAVQGRGDDTLRLRDARRHWVHLSPMALTTAIEDAARVHRFQVCQTGASRVALRVDAAEGAGAPLALRALRGFLAEQGLGQVKAEMDDAPPRIDARSGKLRQVLAWHPPPG